MSRQYLNDRLTASGVVGKETGTPRVVVTYDHRDSDTAAYDSITLGGVGAQEPVVLKNVADGVDDHDAVNLSQLKAAGLIGDDNDGSLKSPVVAYDDATKAQVTLGGDQGTRLSNVRTGTVSPSSMDAINGSQLHGIGQGVADALGGGAALNAEGTLSRPSFTVAGNRYSTVEQAIHAATQFGATSALSVK
ncbi:hypothetical protein K6W12_16995 [Burkholderia multivorans]|uniref:hypothetical protein n=1 Tax=Burkholderia multivorans TaxID=87883 RepID=UPI001C954D40|nr:hypothetical protein [Burkholderia multivorans]MBY4672333.1 hypothetical protein [Burkholderia multivorans]